MLIVTITKTIVEYDDKNTASEEQFYFDGYSELIKLEDNGKSVFTAKRQSGKSLFNNNDKKSCKKYCNPIA